MLRIIIANSDNAIQVSRTEFEKVSIDRGNAERGGDRASRVKLARQLFPYVSEEKLRIVLGKMPVVVPPASMIDLNSNLCNQMGPLEFYNAVKTGGKFDYKASLKGLNLSLEDFGNWHFGLLARAQGFSESTAKVGAGAYQIYSKTTPYVAKGEQGSMNFPLVFTTPTHGDDFFDYIWIGKGSEVYDLMMDRSFNNESLEGSQERADESKYDRCYMDFSKEEREEE
jgi:hypothetical protein